MKPKIRQILLFPLRVVLIVIAIVFCALVLVLSLPFLALRAIRSRLALRRFRRREAGRYYLVCTARHGWYEFLRNNVIPALPEDICAGWVGRCRRPGESLPRELRGHLGRQEFHDMRRPCLVLVTRERILASSLNATLQDLKPSAKRCRQMQFASLRRISQVRAELWQRAGGAP